MANQTARSLRRRMTQQEVKLWVHLRELRKLGYHFRRQSPVSPYIVDFNAVALGLLSRSMEASTPSTIISIATLSGIKL